MAEGNNNKSLEHFVLGIALAVLIFLVLRKEFGRALNGSGGKSGGSGNCGCHAGNDNLPENPGISPGLNSLNEESFAQATVHSHGGGYISAD